MLSLLRTKASDLAPFQKLLRDKAFWRAYEEELTETLTPLFKQIFLAGAETAAKLPMTKALLVEKHYPGGHDHNQQTHAGVGHHIKLEAAESSMKEWSTPWMDDDPAQAAIAAKINGPGGPAYVRGVEEEIRKELAGMNVQIRMSPTTLAKVLKDDGIKTIHETGKSGASTAKGSTLDRYVKRRKETEASLYEGDERPVYGYMQKGAGKNDSLDGYGSARVRLSETVRDRTTFVSGDSLDSNPVPGRPFVAPSPINDPKIQSLSGRRIGKNTPEPMDILKADRDYFYLEAQIFGGVKKSEIASVAFGTKPPASLTKALDKEGIPWSLD